MQILIIFNNHNSKSLLLLMGNIRRLRSDVSITVMFSSRAMAEQHRNQLQQLHAATVIVSGRQVVDFDCQSGEELGGQEKRGELRAALMRIGRRVGNSSVIFYFPKQLWITLNLALMKRALQRFFMRSRFTAVLSVSDRSHDYLEAASLHTARLAKVKVVIPYAAMYDIEAALGYRKDKRGKILREFLPYPPISLYKAISYYRLKRTLYKGIFFQAPYILNAHRAQGTLSSYPWWVGNGLSDVVCVDSARSKNIYRDNRVAEEKIQIIGHSQYDDVYHSFCNRFAIREALAKSYKLDSANDIVILSLPQHFEQGYMESGEHFDLIRRVLKYLSEVDCNLLISMHPRQKIENYRFIEAEFGVRIIQENLSDVIGAARVFVASNSSTLSWANLCGVPAINLLGPTQDLHAFLSNVHAVKDYSEIPSKVQRILGEDVHCFKRDWELLSRAEVFDGKFVERFCSLVET